jgi:hypothetical protein
MAASRLASQSTWVCTKPKNRNQKPETRNQKSPGLAEYKDMHSARACARTGQSQHVLGAHARTHARETNARVVSQRSSGIKWQTLNPKP